MCERCKQLEKENKKLKHLLMKVVDRWWGFVHMHGNLASNAARNIFTEITDVFKEKGN